MHTYGELSIFMIDLPDNTTNMAATWTSEVGRDTGGI
jgi:hypothetical protein